MKITKELAIKAILYGACRIPKIGTEISDFSQLDLIWADESMPEAKKLQLPAWTMAKTGYGDGYGYGYAYGYAYGDGGGGYGCGYGYGYAYGDGGGYGYGDGDGCGGGYGCGDAYAYGDGDGLIPKIIDIFLEGKGRAET